MPYVYFLSFCCIFLNFCKNCSYCPNCLYCFYYHYCISAIDAGCPLTIALIMQLIIYSSVHRQSGIYFQHTCLTIFFFTFPIYLCELNHYIPLENTLPIFYHKYLFLSYDLLQFEGGKIFGYIIKYYICLYMKYSDMVHLIYCFTQHFS